MVRDVDTLNVVHLFSCLDKIQHIAWAADSDYLLCGLYRRAMVQAWSVQQPDWTCKIDEGPAGIAHACWTPDGRQIITCVPAASPSLPPSERTERKSRSRQTALSKTDVMILRLLLAHERFFSSLVFATVATALYQLGTHPRLGGASQ